MYILRLPVTFVSSVVATLGILYLMQYLIESQQLTIDAAENFNLVEFVRIKEEVELQTKQRKNVPPPEPDEPPPNIQPDQYLVSIDGDFSTDLQAPLVQVNVTRTDGFRVDGDYLPIVKIKSVYPRQALHKGLFGWVLVEFTVNENGRVIDPLIIDTCVDVYVAGGSKECVDKPGRIFNGATLVAVKKYKYKPKLVNGTPIKTHGVQNKVFYTLSEMR
jgi:protein TonB